MKETDKAFDRGRYSVMNYFVTLVNKRPGGISDEQIIEVMTDTYKKELQKLDWIRQEKEEMDKQLKKLKLK